MPKDHYVPQFLLRNFSCDPKCELIYVFDKSNSKTFQSNIRKIVCEKNFNKLKINDQEINIERVLASFETSISRVIKKIVSTCSLNSISTEEKAELAHFILLQRFRAKNHLEQVRDLNRKVGDHLKVMGADLNNVKNFKIMDDNDLKVMMFRTLSTASKYIPLLLSKTWFLLKTSEESPFWISDNPVALHNDEISEFRGNLGLKCEGIHIYMPISKSLCLAIICSTFEAKLRKAFAPIEAFFKQIVSDATCKQARFIHPEKMELFRNGRRMIMPFMNAIERGIPMDATKENLEHLNSLQVSFAERFIMASKNDFSLGKTMISDNLSHRDPFRMQMD